MADDDGNKTYFKAESMFKDPNNGRLMLGKVRTDENHVGCKVTEHFRFLDLPSEIRNMIYRRSLGEFKPWKLSSKSFDGSHLQPSLTRVNKKVRAEALHIYYGEDTLCIQITDEENRAVERNSGVTFREAYQAERKAFQRFHRVFDALSAGGTWPPGTSSLGLLKRLDVVYYYYYHSSIGWPGDCFLPIAISDADVFEITFSLDSSRDKHDDEDVKIIEYQDWGVPCVGEGKVGNTSTD
ncbi:hypothetical protein VMCG_06025 [Cytospora schulzeri]|uniref:F-box domain-containing protein n=1 Tax=Cytospora schulzeri TaxID=448051 RepID=A0A423WGM1_9PEZI|nr:hypothetical protein VMCG_06025 [Valsa malicola]